MKPSLHLGKERGNSLVEFALVLPFLLFLTFATVDFSRALRVSNVLSNLTREGANLMSRSADSPQFAQFVMNALGDTALPYYADTGQGGTYFAQSSAILITQITGKLNASNTVDATVTEQYRWLRSGATGVSSHLWNCSSGSWNSDGSCTMPATAPVISLTGLTGSDTLHDGDVFYAVEAFYGYRGMFGGLGFGMGTLIPAIGPNLYAVTMF